MSIVPGGNGVPGGAAVGRTLDRVLSVQRPAVLAHIRTIRWAKPDATPAQVIKTLERRYLAAVTTGGALVGATAAIPAVGTVASLALSTAEPAGFLEASALFALSVTEVHGIAVEDPERARMLVMTMVLGSAGSDLVEQLAAEVVGTGQGRSAFWGELITKNLPKSAVSGVTKRMRSFFIKKFAATQGAGVVGRALPFGVGAVIGGVGNQILGRRMVASSRTAFGAPPARFPIVIEPAPSQTETTPALPQ
jgi:hypothetical protein